jgi:hypothetical protein
MRSTVVPKITPIHSRTKKEGSNMILQPRQEVSPACRFNLGSFKFFHTEMHHEVVFDD